MKSTEEGSTKQNLKVENQRPNGKSSVTVTSATNPYPPPTALYDELVRDATLFWEKLQSFHKSLGTKFK